jgi:hypothetical protein
VLANDELVGNGRRGDLGARHYPSVTGTGLRVPSPADPNQAACRWAHLPSDRESPRPSRRGRLDRRGPGRHVRRRRRQAPAVNPGSF